MSMQCGSMIRLLPKACRIIFLSLPWATHGCDYTLNGPSGQLATYSVLYFFEEGVAVIISSKCAYGYSNPKLKN